MENNFCQSEEGPGLVFFSGMRFAKAWIGALLPLVVAGATANPEPGLAWRSWSPEVFAQAKREHKFVLLDLEAVWCHWCHVMDDVTYRDPAVRRELNAHYLLVKVDQDSRPDISNRYEDYGWPATIVFDGDGHEIVKRQGYMPPKPMLSMLEAIVKDPSPGPSVVPETVAAPASRAHFAPELVAGLKRAYAAQYDQANAGWGFSHKYLDAESVEYAMRQARRGDKLAEQRAKESLRAAMQLIDPVWGGAYQYSAGGHWTEPHFEKLINIQAQTIRSYSLAYAQWHDADYLRVARSVDGYVRKFLTSPEGAFYVSQDADLVQGEHAGEYFQLDDAARRSKGIPRVDTHVYARENGWMIAALCDLYAASADKNVLGDARRAAEWVVAHRNLPGGGFRHAERDAAGPYLGDTLAMGQAFLSLYAVTGERPWLERAVAARQFIDKNFGLAPGRGFATSKTGTDRTYAPHAERDENVQLARFANQLSQKTGDAANRATAGAAMRYLAARENALRPLSGGVLLAEEEFVSDPAARGPVQ